MIDLGPLDLIVPPLMLILAILYLPITIISLLLSGRFSALTSPHAFQQAWFSLFFAFFGPASKPLFAGEVETVLSQATGVVLDVGSGSGDWVDLFSPSRNPKITKVFLLEPNRNFHAKLRQRAERAGLKGKYEILDGGVEDLTGRLGIQVGSFDTISTVHVLCSVKDQRSMIGELYRYLKPGGRWLVYEHVKASEKNKLAGSCQELVNVVWPKLTDGCYLTRDTEDLLRKAGDWESVELRPGLNEGRFCQIPHTVGKLTKRQ